jgi:hypothetical protein
VLVLLVMILLVLAAWVELAMILKALALLVVPMKNKASKCSIPRHATTRVVICPILESLKNFF